MAKKIFEVEISNRGPRGYETAALLKMPATWGEFNDALQKARIEDGRCCQNELTRIEYPGIQREMIGDNVDLYELNLLAQRLSELSKDDQMGMDGLLQIEKIHSTGPISLPRLINLTFNADICLLAPQVSNTQELGALLYEGEMLSDEAMALLDTTEPDSQFQNALLGVFGQKHQEDFDGVFTSQGYVEPGDEFKEVYRRGEIAPYFDHSGAPVVLEVSKGYFDDPGYDNDKTAILNLPATDAAIWRAVEAVDAASEEECAFRCTDCLLPSLRDAINDAIDEEGGIGQINEFAQLLAQKNQIWDANDLVKYKALLSVAGHPSLQDAMQLMHGLDAYELRPEVAQTWEYAEAALREKYPDLPEVLFQTPQAGQVGRELLERDHAVITDYGLLRRKDGSQLNECADSVVVCKSYRQDAYKRRDYYMVDRSVCGIAVYDLDKSIRSGTGMTYNYAVLKKKLPVTVIHPDTDSIIK